MSEWLDLWDYRRRVTEIYQTVRTAADPETGWQSWREARDELFANHPQSALDPDARARFAGLDYYPYRAEWRLIAAFEPTGDTVMPVGHSGTGSTPFRRIGRVAVESPEGPIRLSLFWLDTYAGGVFLPFRDTTNGAETYGGGRYLLDTAKSADLGHEAGRVVLDFNFSYHPSCTHDARWSCPLAPTDNHLSIPVPAGERLLASPTRHP